MSDPEKKEKKEYNKCEKCGIKIDAIKTILLCYECNYYQLKYIVP